MSELEGLLLSWVALFNGRVNAWSLFERRIDKEWGLTDCYSFVVMKKFDIKQALTTDKHLEQAGFEILLK